MWLRLCLIFFTDRTLARKWAKYVAELESRRRTVNLLDNVSLEDDRNRWEEYRVLFEAKRIKDPRSVDGMLDHPDNRKGSMDRAKVMLKYPQHRTPKPLLMSSSSRLPKIPR